MRIFIVLLALSLVSCAGFESGSLTDPVMNPNLQVEGFAGGWPRPCPLPKPCPPCECPGDPDPEQPDNPGQPELLKVMNRYRANAGVAALSLDAKLSCAAEAHSKDIGSDRRCSHTGSDGSSPWDRARRCNTTANGEIVACGQRSEEAAVKAWYNSTGHRNIMLNPRYTKVGMGMSNYFWTAIFR